MSEWKIEVLRGSHDRTSFDCGEKSLNDFLRLYASQYSRRGTGQTHVLTRASGAAVLGFYTLAAGSIEFERLPKKLTKRLAKHPVPVAVLGRLALDRSLHGKGLSTTLLADVYLRVVGIAGQMGIVAIVVDALHDSAAEFYRKSGFEPFEDDPRQLYLSVEYVRNFLNEAGISFDS